MNTTASASTPMKSTKSLSKKENAPLSKGKVALNNTFSPRTPFSPISLNSSNQESNTSFNSTCSFESRELAKQAKIQLTNDRIKKVALLKEKWSKEKERKLQRFQERKAQELKKVNDENQFQLELRKKNLEKKREIEQKEKQARLEQLKVSLDARRQLANDIDQETKAKRRISIFLNKKLREKALQRQKEIETTKKQEELDLLQTRRLDCLSVREYKQLEEAKERERLHELQVEAQSQKLKQQQLLQEQQEREKALIETRRMNFQDELKARADEANNRRQSLVFRLNEWKKHRQIDQSVREQKQQEEKSLIESRHESSKAIENYKKKLAQRDRESLLFRLDKWRQEKDLQQHQKEQQRLAEEMERELQEQALKDVQQYHDNMKEARRQSLAYRLDKAKKDKDYEIGQKALQLMLLEEEKRIKDLDRSDVEEYKKKQEEARRMSLQYRNQHARQERMRQEGEKQTELQRQQEDYKLRQESWQDVQRYYNEQREQRRKSMAWRLADAHRQHEMDLTLHEENLRALHLDMLCKREDAEALQQYKAQERERARKSIEMRLELWRQQRMEEEKEREKRELIAEEDALLREMDREELLANKLALELMEKRNLLSSSIVL